MTSREAGPGSAASTSISTDGTGPTDPRKRIEAIDMVRGFALFGVLLVNMYNFGAYDPRWIAFHDRLAFSVMRVFFETKSWRLFSLLFGLGFSIQLLRAQTRPGRFAPVYLRRMVALFVIGMGHALFYDGDILMLYAELGLVLALFWKAPPRLLLIMAVALLAVFPVGRAVQAIGLTASSEVETPQTEGGPPDPYVEGSVVDVMRVNAEAIPPNPVLDPLGPESGLSFFAMFLLGLYAGMRGFFTAIDEHLPLFRRVLGVGLAVGFIGMTIERALAAEVGYRVFGAATTAPHWELLGSLAFAYGSTALCLGYAAAVVLMAKNEKLRRLVAPLGPVGRLALTVYLTQSLAFTTLFYGYAFGQVGRLGPAAVTVWAVVIFAAQIALCGWWVRRFAYGPAEWAWRAVTYLRLPPMRLPESRSG